MTLNVLPLSLLYFYLLRISEIHVATLIPAYESISPDDLPASERRVLDILHHLDFPGLDVYFSLNLVREQNRGTFRSEADFVLFHPQHGILVWEVKGGGISLENGHWYSTNPRGRYLIKDPVKQSDNAIGALIDRCNKKLPPNCRFPIGRNVVFPDTVADHLELPLGLLRQDIIDHNNLKQLTADYLIKLFKRWPQQEQLPVSKENATRIRSHVLNPSFHLTPCVHSQIDQVETRLIQLTNQQAWALELLKFIPRLTVTGGAGTGKTLLARQKTTDLVDEGKRVLTLCFNNGLAQYLKASLSELQQAHPEHLNVSSFHEFAKSCLENTHFKWQPPKGYNDQRHFYEEVVPQELEAYASEQTLRYDALVVDEAQDFHPLWWIALEPFLQPDAAVYLFADPAQNLYGRDFEIPTDIFSGMIGQPFYLPQNCRNSFEIATWLTKRFSFASTATPLLPTSGYEVKEVRWQTAEQQEKEVIAAWNALAREGVKPEQVAILSPYRADNSQSIQALQAAFPDLPFKFSTINAFKGLQAPFVFLVDMDTGDFASREDLWYVGCTRATLGLQIFAQKHA